MSSTSSSTPRRRRFDIDDIEPSCVDADTVALSKMGYHQSLNRTFSPWSLIGVGFSVTNSWFGISAALVAGINSGGPALLVYGIPLVVAVNICTGITLAELASAMPNSGGQYFWTSQLADRSYAASASYLTGWFGWSGAIFTSASVALSLASAIVGCWQLAHPDFVIHRWHVFVAYQVVNGFCAAFNCSAPLLPRIATVTLFLSLASFAVIIVTVPSVASEHQPASFVFGTFINNTGWPSDAIAFIVGLVNANWAFSCLDCATHLAEEVRNPEKAIPVAIMATLAIGFSTAWVFSIAMLFSIVGDFDQLVHTPTLVPILQLFYQALRSRLGAIVLESLIIGTGIGCLIASHTWQSRLCWSFSRDGGLPAHEWLSRVAAPPIGVPINAHVASCIVVGIIGTLYLASETAFNSMATACITLLYVSYSIPVVCLLLRGRSSIETGPFWMPKLGLVSNIVLLGWTIFSLVFYSLPYSIPVKAGNMNYVTVVYAAIVAIVLIDWKVRGKRQYTSGNGRPSLQIGPEGSAEIDREEEQRRSCAWSR